MRIGFLTDVKNATSGKTGEDERKPGSEASSTQQ